MSYSKNVENGVWCSKE